MVEPWSEERLKLLTELVGAGVSARQIGIELGMSKNAIVGKMHREGLFPNRKPKAPPRPRKRRRADRTLKQVKVTVHIGEPSVGPPWLSQRVADMMATPPETEQGVSLMDLEPQHCRAIIGTGSDGSVRFCGAAKEGRISTYTGIAFSSSYCAEHGRLYFNRLARR